MKGSGTTLASKRPLSRSRTKPRPTFLRSPRKGTSRLSNIDGGTTSQVLKLIRSKPFTSREIAERLGIGQKGALYHLGKLKAQRLADFDSGSLLWRPVPAIATHKDLLEQFQFLVEFSNRYSGHTKKMLGATAHTLSQLMVRDFGAQ